MHKSNPTIASIQMVSGANFKANLTKAELLITNAANEGADLVVLPEYFALMPNKERDKFEFMENHLDGVMQQRFSKLAKKLEIWIVAGTHPIQSDEKERPFGRCYVFNDLGEQVAWYDKIHLFDVEVADNQGSYCESKYTKAGQMPVFFDTPWGKIGLAVCYDLRFPELFRFLSEADCEIFIMPAAFTYATGEVHWQTLIKARAIENLCYFVASAQGGSHENGRQTWGHSCIVSPWGEVLQDLPTGEGYVLAELDREKQATKRKEFPVLLHKKL